MRRWRLVIVDGESRTPTDMRYTLAASARAAAIAINRALALTDVSARFEVERIER